MVVHDKRLFLGREVVAADRVVLATEQNQCVLMVALYKTPCLRSYTVTNVKTVIRLGVLIE